MEDERIREIKVFELNENSGMRVIKGVLENVAFEVGEDIGEEGLNDETSIELITLTIDKREVFIFPSFNTIKIGEIPPLFSALKEGKKRLIVIRLRRLGSSLIAFDYDLKNALISEVIKE